MPRWHGTTWLIVTWTLSIAGLFVSMSIENNLRYIDIIGYAVDYFTLWLAGMVPFGIIWVLVYVRRDWISREPPGPN